MIESDRHIFYRDGLKYQLVQPCRVLTPILPPEECRELFIRLSTDGVMHLATGYAWDGGTWCPDYRTFMRPTAIHDAFYTLMRKGWLDAERYRAHIDVFMRKMCIEDGMDELHAWVIYQGVRLGAGANALPPDFPAHCAP